MNKRIVLMAVAALLLGCGKGQSYTVETFTCDPSANGATLSYNDGPPITCDGGNWEPAEATPSPTPRTGPFLAFTVTSSNGDIHLWDGGTWRKLASGNANPDIPAPKPTPKSAPSPAAEIDSMRITINARLDCHVEKTEAVEGHIATYLKCHYVE